MQQINRKDRTARDKERERGSSKFGYTRSAGTLFGDLFEISYLFVSRSKDAVLRDAEGERGERQIRENRLYDIVKFTWLQLIRAAGCMCSRVHAYVRVVPIDRDRCRIETELCYICTFCGWDDSVSVLYRNRGNFIHTTGASFGSTCYRLVKKKASHRKPALRRRAILKVANIDT